MQGDGGGTKTAFSTHPKSVMDNRDTLTESGGDEKVNAKIYHKDERSENANSLKIQKIKMSIDQI